MPDSSDLLFDRAFAAIPAAFSDMAPACGLILGSGWSHALPPGARPLASVAYAQVPGLGASTVAGHSGRLVLLQAGKATVAAFCGRRHWYEGEGWNPVVIPVEIMRRLGIRRLLLTNAAGGINPDVRPGSLLLLRDHVNTTGINPLQGPVRPGWGPRFPDQSSVYAPELARRVLAAAAGAGIHLAEGIYAFTAGPAYETPAEVRAYGIWGVDAVGMSTVPEAVVANAMGMQVAAVSCITNMAAGISGPHLSHEEVLAETAAATPKMARLLEAAIAALAEP